MSLCCRAFVVAMVFFAVALAHVNAAALGPSPLTSCPESLFRVSSSASPPELNQVSFLMNLAVALFSLQVKLHEGFSVVRSPTSATEEEKDKTFFFAPSSWSRHHQLMQDRETQLRTPPCSSPLRISALQNLFKLTKALHSNRPSHPFVREDRTPKDLTTFCRAL